MDIDYDNLLETSDYEQDEDSQEQIEFSDIDIDEDDEDESEIKNYTDINKNLSDYLESLENKHQEGKIDDYTFALENLLVQYKQALIHRRFNIDNEVDNQKIERIRQLKKELEEELINDKIEEFEFNRKYYNLLDLEFNLLLKI